MRIADILRKPTADMSEVQDFSMSSSKSRGGGGGMGMTQSGGSPGGKGKLNDMLTKLMKKNNVPMEEPQPPLSKEKKRRKLDEIVMGLSAASKAPEQKSIFGDPGLSLSSSKKPQIQPSVSVTPANQSQSQSHSNQNQKPFTITVTSVPGKSKFAFIEPNQQNSHDFHSYFRFIQRTFAITKRIWFFRYGGSSKHEQFVIKGEHECDDFASGTS